MDLLGVQFHFPLVHSKVPFFSDALLSFPTGNIFPTIANRDFQSRYGQALCHPLPPRSLDNSLHFVGNIEQNVPSISVQYASHLSLCPSGAL